MESAGSIGIEYGILESAGWEEQNQAYFYSKIGHFWAQKVFGMFDSIMFIFKIHNIQDKWAEKFEFHKLLAWWYK